MKYTVQSETVSIDINPDEKSLFVIDLKDANGNGTAAYNRAKRSFAKAENAAHQIEGLSFWKVLDLLNDNGMNMRSYCMCD